MEYRSGTSYLIRDTVKREEGLHGKEHDQEDEEHIEVDDEEGEFNELRNEELMDRDELTEYKKKYTFTQRKPATLYHCDQCNKTFKHPSKIAEHLRRHTKERPFGCEVCGARFSQGGSLKVHLRAHLGELPYKCSYCDRHFATPYNQRLHEAVHLRGGRFQRELRDRQMAKDERLKMLASASLAHQKRGGGEEEGVEDELYECGVHNCGYQHHIREMVEHHVQTEHADIWDEGMEGVEGEEIVEGEEGAEYQNYAYYEFVEHDTLIDGQRVVVMTEEEVAAVNAANRERREQEEEDDHLPSSTTPLSPQLSLHSQMGMHPNALHPSTSNGGSLVIEADEHIDDESMGKAMTDDGRAKRLRLLTLGRTGMSGARMVKEEMYPEMGYSADAPLATYEVEVMTSRETAAASAAEVSSTMDDDDDDSQPVFSEMARAQMMQDELECVDGSDRVRILSDYRPPPKRRQTGYTKWDMDMESEEAELERALMEEVMPRPARMNNRRKKRAGPPANSRNLDWIIDAVAEGRDVDQASPHNRKKPMIHTCQFCGKVDKYPSKIEAHMRTHTGEKPFTCDFCGIGFAQKTPLRMHMRRHLNERSFACEADGCTARFISQALLNAHTQSKHLNTKRFVCMKGCGRWFANGRNQRQHESKCNHIINRTTVNVDYGVMEGGEYVVEATDESGVAYMEEEEEVEEEEDGGEYEEALLMENGEDPDMEAIPPTYL